MILDLLAQKRSATVLELCDALDASESTIRRDLTQLDRQGLLKKVHGGATLVGRTVLADEPPMAAREEQSVEEKRLIARAAAAMITEKDFIFLDAGSTTLALAAAPVETIPDGRIDFDHVSFKYNAKAEKNALSDITLHIPAGATVGIIGGTGAAKTTLVQLIPRLYDATEGTVRVGGRDVRGYDVNALRDAVGIVLQKNLLFSGTIRDNLKWGDPDATDDDLWAACRAARADEFLSRMPDGLDTDLGQGGCNVSGGQKQRLCIARTLLKHPKVLIFDDSTSAVDTATESGIRHALAGLGSVTKLIIAQRITSVQSADLIVILDDGRLHAVGTHDELLAKDTIYQEIYHSQMKGGDADGEAIRR